MTITIVVQFDWYASFRESLSKNGKSYFQINSSIKRASSIKIVLNVLQPVLLDDILIRIMLSQKSQIEL
ncbi:hypothetical protein pb186bvf_004960 [Paramecium bursaria]